MKTPKIFFSLVFIITFSLISISTDSAQARGRGPVVAAPLATPEGGYTGSFVNSYIEDGYCHYCYTDGCVKVPGCSATTDLNAPTPPGWPDYRLARSVEEPFQMLDNWARGIRQWAYGAKTRRTYDSNGILVGIGCVNNPTDSLMRASGCANRATNYPTCTICPSGKTMINNVCTCTNGGTGSQCDICPSGLVMENNICTCSNGATNPSACNTCPAGANMEAGQCVCSNGATPQSNCAICPTGKVMHQGQCLPGCNLTNVCGQESQGVTINGRCSAPDGGNINSSCITTFDVTSDRVNPNGSVEFTWSIANLQPNVKQTCGFYDYTTPTPRPIPGLQNLDTTQEKARISNIQTTTRFCLVCNFYNATTNASLGDAVQHQWIRVIRIGEN